MGTNSLYRRAGSCSYPALQLGTSRADHMTCRRLGTCFAEESGSGQGRVLSWQPLGILMAAPPWGRPFSLSVELATHFLLVPRKNKSHVKSKSWLGGGNAGQLPIVVFSFVVYEIIAVHRFFKKHWKCLSFISLIYLKHNTVMGKYCYFMILITHVILKISVLCDESNAYVLLWRDFEEKKKAI